MAHNNSLLSGIQQVGIGVTDAEAAFTWYRRNLGMDVPVFKDASTAELMVRYTGNEARKRYAILAMNMQGGGGFEIWQYTSRVPQPAAFQIQAGDLGIFGILMKCRDVKAAHASYKAKGLAVSDVFLTPDGGSRFHLNDPYGNRFTFTPGLDWFDTGKHPNGGITGVQIGVSDMDRSLKFYQETLGFNQVIFDQTGPAPELGSGHFRRVLLRPNPAFGGAFRRLLGAAEVELIQSMHHIGRKVFENRFWGDLGYIHVCFDVNDMDGLEKQCAQKGSPFTVNSRDSFDMGEAAGHFTYTEDPDGTLIEFVQTHRIPLVKKIGWYLDLKKRGSFKPLPDWMLRTLGWGRVKD
jgi:catechol 2,3-dioxygenase-like lactoylglutathione lyase family enzyme